MPKFFINISRGYNIHDYYDSAYKNLYQKNNIKTILFFNRDLSKDKFIDETYNDYKQIYFYDTKIDLLEKIKKINIQDIYYINTFDELVINLLNEIKSTLGFSISTHHEAFRNKYLQREILQKNYPETTVRFYEINLEKDNIDNYNNKLDFPFIIKPVSGAQSLGVTMINSKEDLQNYEKEINKLISNISVRGYNDLEFIIEEYIDGNMYSIDYFVNQYGEIFYTSPVNIKLLYELGENDFGNYVRVNGKIIDNDINMSDLKIFVQKHVKAFGIKNTFIHHEFKINKKNEFKNIELNARIGGFRLEMIQNVYDFNILTMPLNIGLNSSSNISNAVFAFYPREKGILSGFNEKLIETFMTLKSYHSIKTLNKYIGKQVGLSKDGFGNLSTLKIKNNDIEQFKLDYDFVEKNYSDFIILENNYDNN